MLMLPTPPLVRHAMRARHDSSSLPMLRAQCAATNPSSIWPLEDAVEFQGVAAELRSAAAGQPPTPL